MTIGYLLYYGRCVDARMLPAVCSLASEQALPTSATMSRLDRLLGYASSHSNGRKVYRASGMVLGVLSDASYLSRPKAGDVVGSHHFLGHEDDDEFLNHPISNHSTRIPVVCSFVAEAEYAGVFAAARIAVDERQILTMGHPQPATTIFCDNEVAIGLANNTVTPKMSKSLVCAFIGCGTGFSRVNFASSSSLAFKIWPILFYQGFADVSPSLSGPIHCIR